MSVFQITEHRWHCAVKHFSHRSVQRASSSSDDLSVPPAATSELASDARLMEPDVVVLWVGLRGIGQDMKTRHKTRLGCFLASWMRLRVLFVWSPCLWSKDTRRSSSSNVASTRPMRLFWTSYISRLLRRERCGDLASPCGLQVFRSSSIGYGRPRQLRATTCSCAVWCPRQGGRSTELPRDGTV